MLNTEGGAEMLQAARYIAGEFDIDMKLADGALSLLAPEWRMRRHYRWYVCNDVVVATTLCPRFPLVHTFVHTVCRYVFNDVIMVARPNTFVSGFKKKLLLQLDNGARHTAQCRCCDVPSDVMSDVPSDAAVLLLRCCCAAAVPRHAVGGVA
jgi:hypothetical protein